MEQNGSAPENVGILYRKAGETHVLASDGCRGLVHAGSSDPRQCHELFIDALQAHVLKTYGAEALYEHETDADAFLATISDGAEHRFAARLKTI